MLPTYPAPSAHRDSAGKGDVDEGDVKGSVTGLGEMYAANRRFAKNYGGAEGAGFFREALNICAAENL